MKHLFVSLILFFTVQSIFAQSDAKIIANKGQWHPNILYNVPLSKGNLFAEKGRFLYQLFENDYGDFSHTHNHLSKEENRSYKAHAYAVNFVGADKEAKIREENLFADVSNFYYGNNPKNWAANVNSCKDIHYQSLWQGIDLHLYSKEGNLKYDFIVKAHQGQASNIRLQYEGIDRGNMSIDEKGDLVIVSSVQTIKELKPSAYQWLNGKQIAVDCAYQLSDQQEITFNLGANYDPNVDLIIDPIVVFSTFTGSTQDNWGFTATYDAAGNAYGGGIVWGAQAGSTGYPTLGAFQTVFQGGDRDIALTKFNHTGSGLIFSTYFGGSLEEQPQSMVVNSQGELIVLGRTTSTNFPVNNAFDASHNGQFDIFLAKFSPTGALLASTFFGGSGDEGINGTLVSLPETFTNDYLNYNYGDDARCEVKVDAADNVFLVSSSSSNDFPTTSGCYQSALAGGRDAVVAKFDPSLSALQWATFYGGTNLDAAYGLAIDNSNNVFITGSTRSTNLPTTSNSLHPNTLGGNTDGFIAKLNSSGASLLSATYIGTVAADHSFFIAIDNSQNIYVTGQNMGNFPTVNANYSVVGARQFIAKLDNNLSGILFSTTYGKANQTKPDVCPTAFNIDANENLYVATWGGDIQQYSPGGISSTGAGGNNTLGLTTTSNAIKNTTDGNDFYIFVMEKNANSLLYATYFGGTTQEHVDGGSSRFSPDGVLYEAVCACGSIGTFPTTSGAWSQTNSNNNCNLALFVIDFQIPQAISTETTNANPFSIYPNPSKEVIHIQGKETYSYQLINSLGQQIYGGKQCNAPELNLNTSNLPTGIYFLKIVSENKSYIERIVIEK